MLLSKRSDCFSKNWVKPNDVCLNSLLKLGEKFVSTQSVLKRITTNRTNIPGNDILSTPGMIETMNLHVSGVVNKLLNEEHASVVSKIKCFHKAPLKIGEKFTVTAEVEAVDRGSAVFHVVCNSDKNVVVGDARITVNVIGIKSK